MIVQYTCGCWHCLEDDQTPETRCPSCCEKMYTQLVRKPRKPQIGRLYFEGPPISPEDYRSIWSRHFMLPEENEDETET